MKTLSLLIIVLFIVSCSCPELHTYHKVQKENYLAIRPFIKESIEKLPEERRETYNNYIESQDMLIKSMDEKLGKE